MGTPGNKVSYYPIKESVGILVDRKDLNELVHLVDPCGLVPHHNNVSCESSTLCKTLTGRRFLLR